MEQERFLLRPSMLGAAEATVRRTWLLSQQKFCQTISMLNVLLHGQVEQERFLVRPSMLGGADVEDPGHLTRVVRCHAKTNLVKTARWMTRMNQLSTSACVF